MAQVASHPTMQTWLAQLRAPSTNILAAAWIKIMWKEQLADPVIHYLTSVIAPWSSELNKPVNSEPCY